ncbi:transglutaminase-like domain-containing protein [Tautonia plasticadhaerens]|uniref:Transglutaminase-like superfamily protein n=1 Tax=Tautonia plasticadhaerens TaxID=2527974 RepID=A0A518H3A7_9BACT|nr:transglutaminase family protein [Tautonia plasticadhaerens]QDV35329.1 Transglutaminase-like superfamily protein [Tautonia plasticadhaerens]QDV39300.1 Transglutaminase-like superfamily protein [Tautonia plasticadhaerens]
MLLAVRATATYELQDESFAFLMVEPPLSGARHRVVEERLTTTPTRSCELRRDLYGNPQRHLIAPKGRFSFEFSATVEADPNAELPEHAAELPPHELPAEALVYTLPSRYCESDLLGRMAQTEFGRLPPGGGRVRAVAEWVRGHVEYRYGTSGPTTSARDTAIQRVGVCRDFAHLVIAFCRALDIPARYVSGYALGLEPPDFHGFVQVYLGEAWHNIDATTGCLRPALVPIAVGRDAADAAMMTLWTPHEVVEQAVEVRRVAE